ncbi:MAG: hypothetical protein CMG36_02090 [Candidatus Marinimicrobia bacterium]|jgi:hypothetical protein|nr:hypothetical protein [Candidatus Neomarinimicrobiota bacterium]MBO69631.1 hypothetical protein [Candidatus Neomarinimicrobiota bacterium]
MHSFVLIYILKNSFILLLLFTSFIFSQYNDVDTLQSKSPQTAAIRSFVFPGGGQYYNGQPIKGAVLSTFGVASAVLYMDFSEKYKNSEGVSQSDKKNFLHQRNRYGWWIIIVYIYGLLDAVVEAHLHPFNEVMNEDLEKPDQEDLKQK